MFEALAVARLALDLKEVPVGCVIVNKENVIIGKGNNFNLNFNLLYSDYGMNINLLNF